MAEETAKSAEKRATQFEEDINTKNNQLDELYNEIDSM